MKRCRRNALGRASGKEPGGEGSGSQETGRTERFLGRVDPKRRVCEFARTCGPFEPPSGISSRRTGGSNDDRGSAHPFRRSLPAASPSSERRRPRRGRAVRRRASPAAARLPGSPRGAGAVGPRSRLGHGPRGAHSRARCRLRLLRADGVPRKNRRAECGSDPAGAPRGGLRRNLLPRHQLRRLAPVRHVPAHGGRSRATATWPRSRGSGTRFSRISPAPRCCSVSTLSRDGLPAGPAG